MPKLDLCGRPWIVEEYDENLASRLADEAGVTPVVARLLAIRGIESGNDVRAFLNPSLDLLHDPDQLPDIKVGIERLAKAVESGERICVHGDYDVDGVTSAALLVRTLKAVKANVEYRLPHRQREGYDIKPATIEDAAQNGVKLIITCDCGTTAINAIKLANELGVDVIVTDHHEPGPELPPAVAIINPKRADSMYPFTGLAGVGVAFKVAQALVRRLGYDEKSFMARFVDLAALGTVGDVVPLIDENRSIVKYGLEAIQQSKKVGLQAMLKHTNLIGKTLSAYYLGFVLSPRINAVGRMDDAATALRLLLTKDEDEANALVEEMEHHNTQRKTEQDKILAEALEQVEAKDLSQTPILILSNVGWNSGVVGIVAGRIREIYGRPAVLLNRDIESGFGTGSARSIPGFNIVEGFRHCHDLLHKYGGHALAAGLSVSLDNLEVFETRINALALQILPEEELLPRVDVDAEISASQITRELADDLSKMEPFGTGNPEPLFITNNLAVQQIQRVGDGSHLKMRLQGEDSAPINCIAFGMGDASDVVQTGSKIDLCYNIRLNNFNGIESVQLMGKAIRL